MGLKTPRAIWRFENDFLDDSCDGMEEAIATGTGIKCAQSDGLTLPR